MAAKQPKVTFARSGYNRRLGNGVCRIDGARLGPPLSDQVDFGSFPAEHFNRDFANLDEGGEFDCQEFLVPAAQLAKSVISQTIGANLRLAPLSGDDDRDLGKAKSLSGCDPGVSGNDVPLPIDEYWEGKSEFPYRGHQFYDLLFGMAPGVVLVGYERTDGFIFDRPETPLECGELIDG
jgi:hypothetical protein